jgi:hypothetical protein
MTTTTPSLRRLTPQAAVLLLVAAVAWLVTVGRAGAMAGMTGTMSLSLAAFVGMWALMMAAMMLPSVAPVASMYQRSVRSWRALRLAGFTAGYLLVWVGAGTRRSCSPRSWRSWWTTIRPGRPRRPSWCSPPAGCTSSPR